MFFVKHIIIYCFFRKNLRHYKFAQTNNVIFSFQLNFDADKLYKIKNIKDTWKELCTKIVKLAEGKKKDKIIDTLITKYGLTNENGKNIYLFFSEQEVNSDLFERKFTIYYYPSTIIYTLRS